MASPMMSERKSPLHYFRRSGSFLLSPNSVLWWAGEQPQTRFIDQNVAAHINRSPSPDMEIGSSSLTNYARPNYGTKNVDLRRTIRFQVIVWSVAKPDVLTQRVQVKFRVTLFWNDVNPSDDDESARSSGRASPTIWAMSGRNRAYERRISSNNDSDLVKTVEVPPVSVLNADSFEVIGQPEVSLLREESKLMRWTAMYRCNLSQEDMRVENFPHDEHTVSIRLGILSDRQPGGKWDKTKWKLALATETDTQMSIRIPYGVLVDHVRVPEFSYDTKKGLEFEFKPLSFGPQKVREQQDAYLKVKLVLKRDSSYYDRNIMPLLGMLNLVAISVLCLDATQFFQRGLLTLNIAFVEIGLRMTLDDHLPNVGYQIKIQKILNWFFYSLLAVVLESSLLHVLLETGGWSLSNSRVIDLIVAFIAIANHVYLLTVYYMDKSK